MTNEELKTAVYDKMAAEQETFKAWLVKQPPEEILNNTYAYTVREDILVAMEDVELSDAQAKALLDSPSPLAEVYDHFSGIETGYMDIISESIEVRAGELAERSKQKEEAEKASDDRPSALEKLREKQESVKSSPVTHDKRPADRGAR